jgi:hypothetical protein
MSVRKKTMDFAEKIDCKFPYDDFKKGKELIDEALGISHECVFMVVEELVRPSRCAIGKYLSIRRCLIDYISASLNHPLKDTVLEIARSAMNRKKRVLRSELITALKEIENYPHSYGALNTVYFANWSCCEDLEKMDKQIREKWDAKDRDPK